MADEIERLWGITEVAEYLGLPVTTLYQWRYRGYGSPGRRIGRHVRYDPAAVRDWFNAQDSSAATER